MKTLLEFIGYNIASIIFLLFTMWGLNNDHLVFAIIAFIVAIYGGIKPKTS